MSSSASKVWKEAATLIMAARSRGVGRDFKLNGTNHLPLKTIKDIEVTDQNYKVLMLKRSKSMRWGSTYVFPGGTVDKADFSTKWWSVFEKRGPSALADVRALIHNNANARPEFLKAAAFNLVNQDSSDDILPPDVALRLAAIRETFEECGILVARPNNVAIEDQAKTQVVDDTKKWQELVQKDANEMINLCLEMNCCPDIWALHEWSAWLTPSYMKSRFATAFYLCSLDEKSQVTYSTSEVTNHLWVSPLRLLEMNARNEMWLPPPQIYELSRLLNFSNLDDLNEFAKKRQELGLITNYPIHVPFRDGFLHILPGDDLYPEKPDFVSEEHSENLEYTLQSMDQAKGNMHRIVFTDENKWKLLCNIKLSDGHTSPIQLQGEFPAKL